MWKYNIKIAFRNIARNRTFSFINVLGLTIGLASCIVIGLYALNELTFDHFHLNHSRLYRINKITNEKNKEAQTDGITPGNLGPVVSKDIPGVVAACRFRPWFNDMLVSYDTIKINVADVVYADNAFLTMFHFPLLDGNKKNALAEPFTAVLTETTAKKYFGNKDPIGKTLTTLNNIPVKITGVAKDVPDNSSIRFNMLISMATVEAPASQEYFSWMTSWTTNVDYTFVELQPFTNAVKAGDKISVLLHSHFPEKEFQYRTYLQPLDDIHLGSKDIFYAESFRTNSSSIIYTLLAIAGLILMIACFNFVNLTTSGALARAKETGVQKVLGARQSQLVKKFFSESFLLCTLSLIIALIIVSIILPLFNNLAGANLTVELLFQLKIAGALVALLLLLSLAAGLYPAIFLARFKSTDVFRNVIKAGKDGWLRKTLVITQFTFSILLVIATIVVNKQMNYMATKDLGFDKDQVVVLRLANTGLESKSGELITALKQNHGIESVSASNRVPGQTFNGYGIIPEGHTGEEHLLSNVFETDTRFAATYNIKLTAGRYFSSTMPTDTTESVVINEAMANMLGWNPGSYRDAVGKQFEIYETRKGKVIGVMKDFNFASLRKKVEPLAVILTDNPLYISVKVRAGTIPSSLAYMQKTWKQFTSEHPFDYFFLNEQLNHFYESDVKLLYVLNIFAVLAIFIACIGLFGLSIYTAKQKTKEIGIRKVLGATVTNIVAMLSKDFLKLVLVATIVAFPVAWWAMNDWLQDFAYRIDISWVVFAIAGLSAISIALFTISFQAIKAAVANPVKSLRTE
ncbi:MAG: ABC transporter permease [Ginsengibacter sp.]